MLLHGMGSRDETLNDTNYTFLLVGVAIKASTKLVAELRSGSFEFPFSVNLSNIHFLP